MEKLGVDWGVGIVRAMSLEFKAVLGEMGGQLCLDRVSATGLPKEEVGRYYPDNF